VRKTAFWLVLFPVLALSACASSGTGTETGYRKGVVERGSIDEVVSATGLILPQERVELRFDGLGIVEEVFVDVGDHVVAGQPLARLDTTLAESAVRQAELSLEIQQLRLEQLNAVPTEGELAAARASVNSAVANYQSVVAPPDSEQVRIAELQFERAFNQFEQASIDLRNTAPFLQGGALIPLQESVKQSLIQVEIARLRLEQLGAGPDAFSAAAAAASIAEAQARLDALFAPANNLNVAQMQTQIDQAQLSLQQAIERLDAATLYAPFTGVISAVNISTGQVSPTNLPAVVVIDNSYLHVSVNIDELDIGRVSPGQPARVTLDALPGTVIDGQVTALSPSATNTNGVITYEARIDLAEQPEDLLPGMTATAQVIVQSLTDTLVVPNWAVRFDRESGQAYVGVLQDDETIVDLPVALGVRGENRSQVIAGLEEGQVVAVALTREQLDIFGAGEEGEG